MFEDLVGAGIIGTVVVIAIAVFVIIFIIKNLLYICPPNEVLIFSGRKRKTADGKTVGFRIIKGGRGIKIPFLEIVDRMTLNVIPIEVSVTSAYSKGGIPLNVQGIANVKIASEEIRLGNALERFLGKKIAEIKQVAKETLEGNLRGVLATLTPEQVNEDRLKFAEELLEEADNDLAKLGLVLDTLKIQNVSDDTGYLDSIGRKQTAEILKQAEVSEADNRSQAQVQRADAEKKGKVAEAEAHKEIAIAENALRVKRAVLAADANAAEERATVAGEVAKAQSEQELQTARKELETRRLEADVIAPAAAEREAKELKAKGEAAKILEDGRATAEVLRMMREEWMKAGPNAKDIFLIQKLESIVGMIVGTVKGINIDKVTVVDSGSGTAIPSLVRSLPASVTGIIEQLKTTTGIDIPSILESYTKKPASPESQDQSITTE